MAGPEVVERNTHAEVLYLAQRVQRAFTIGEDGRFRQLDFQSFRR
jgi:hypothetical protein